MSRRTWYILLAVWCAYVLPLAMLGYGRDPDAWRVARVAEILWTTGQYTVSRSVGFPLFELLATPFVHAGKWYASNMIAVVAGIAVMAALFRLAKRQHLRQPVLCVLSVAFLPLFVTSASSTMDYIPALALLLWSYVALTERRWTLAALLIGVACGFRPTSGIFVIPAGIYAYLETKRMASVVRMLVIAAVAGFLAYSPAFFRYGIHIPQTAVELHAYIRILRTGYNGLKAFGIVQTTVLLAVLVPAVRRRIRREGFDSFLAFHLSVIALWILLFARRGDEPEYLMPLVPSVVLILDRTVSKRAFAIVAVVLLSYGAVQVDLLGGESGARTIDVSVGSGYIVRDAEDRLFKLSTREAATAYVAHEKTLLMFGNAWIPVTNDAWIHEPEHGWYRQRDGDLYVSGRILDQARLPELRAAGFRLVVWRGEKWELIRSGIEWQDHVEVVDDLSAFFGAPLKGRAATVL